MSFGHIHVISDIILLGCTCMHYYMYIQQAPLNWNSAKGDILLNATP